MKSNRMDADEDSVRNGRNVQDVVPHSMIRGYVQKGFFYRCLLKDISQDMDDLGLPFQPMRTALATRIQVPNLPPLLLPVMAHEFLRVRISYVAEPNRVFVQLENNARTIIKVSERLRELAKRRHEPLCNPECGTIVAALYPHDRCYYRACVVSKVGFDSAVMFYIDYGNVEPVDFNDAFLLKDRELLSVPPQAVQVVMKDVHDSGLTTEQIDSLLADQTVGAQIMNVNSNGESFIAILHVRDEKNKLVNLTEVLLGERPAPTLPPPKPFKLDSFSDEEDEYVDENRPDDYHKSNSGNFARSGNFGGATFGNHFGDPSTHRSENMGNTSGFDGNRRTGFRGGRDDGADFGNRFSNFNSISDSASNDDFGIGRTSRNDISRLFDDMSKNSRFSDSNRRDGGSFRDQNRGKNGFSFDDRSNTGGQRGDRAGGSGPFGRSICHNCGERGHFARECREPRKSGFGGSSRSSGSERFGGDGGGFSRFGTDRGGGRSGGGGSFGGPSGFGESKEGSGGNFGARSRRSSEKSDHSHRSFLDRENTSDDTIAEKSGWKSGNWTTAPETIDTITERSEVNNSSNTATTTITENRNMNSGGGGWEVNGGGWDLNNGGWDLTDDNNKTEISMKNSTNAAAEIGKGNIDGGVENVGSSTQSATGSTNAPVNAFGVPLPPPSSATLRIGAAVADNIASDAENEITFTTKTEFTSSNEESAKRSDDQVSSSSSSSTTISRIESSALLEIKFGDTVNGLRSDGLEIADPSSFFVQLERDENTIVHLSLPELPPDLPKLSNFEVSQACMALCLDDYYRAEIVGKGDNNKQRVVFVDYGNMEDISASELYVLNKSLPELFHKSRRMAFQCRLYNVMPVASKHTFDIEARREFSRLTAGARLRICFLHQSIKGIYEVNIQLTDGRSVSDILIARGFAVPFKWGIGPQLSLYEKSIVFRSDDLDHIQPIFTVQLLDSLKQLEMLNGGYVESKKALEALQVGDVVIAYFEESPYRAEIIGVENDNDKILYRLRYVDYGNESLNTKEECFVLDRDEQPDDVVFTPRQGIQCRIEGVRPSSDTDGEQWCEDAQKCLDNLLAPSTSFEAIVGTPNANGVHPFRVMVAEKQLNDKNHSSNTEDKEKTDENDDEKKEKIDLATWLLTKGYAKIENHWNDYPTVNLLTDGMHEYEMIITEIDGQIIRARPCAFTKQYDELKKALANIEMKQLEADATTGLITFNGENKRVMLVSATNDDDDVTTRKCLLVDEGVCMDELPAELFGTDGLGDSNGFLIRTCHQLSVQLRLCEHLLNDELKQTILTRAADGPAKVLLFEYGTDGSYLIGDILFANGTSLEAEFTDDERMIALREEAAASESGDNAMVEQIENLLDENSLKSKSPAVESMRENGHEVDLVIEPDSEPMSKDNVKKAAEENDSDDSDYTEADEGMKKDSDSSDTEYGIMTSETESETELRTGENRKHETVDVHNNPEQSGASEQDEKHDNENTVECPKVEVGYTESAEQEKKLESDVEFENAIQKGMEHITFEGTRIRVLPEIKWEDFYANVVGYDIKHIDKENHAVGEEQHSDTTSSKSPLKASEMILIMESGVFDDGQPEKDDGCETPDPEISSILDSLTAQVSTEIDGDASK